MTRQAKLDVVVADVVQVTDLIKRFEFVPADGGELPGFSGGAHVVVEMQDGHTRRLNPYSLMSDPADLRRYAISVRRDDSGRGGSAYLHRAVQPGDRLVISRPQNLFALDRTARKHLMVAGGIGITPFLSQVKQLLGQKGRFGNAGLADLELHYYVQSRAMGAYVDALEAMLADKVQVHVTGSRPNMDLAPILARQPLGTHLYICGPKGMIGAAIDQAQAAGWPDGTVHFEEFLAPAPGTPFTVELAASRKTIEVGARQSLLEALEAADVDPPYMCRGGACGQCETNVLTCDGTIEHRDHWLDPEQRAAGAKIMPCVSRFSGARLVLDR